MKNPPPKVGEVIFYHYLWARENKEQKEAQKGRPCLVVDVEDVASGAPLVTVLPITHSHQISGQEAVEMPTTVKQRLGLSDFRSWVMLNEYNEFTWPSDNVRNIPGKKPTTHSYGQLSAFGFKTINDKLIKNVEAGRVQAVRHDSDFLDRPEYRKGRRPNL